MLGLCGTNGSIGMSQPVCCSGPRWRICFGFKPALFSPGYMGCSVSYSCFELSKLGEIFVHSPKWVSSGHCSAFLAAHGDSDSGDDWERQLWCHCELPCLPWICHQLSAEVEGGILLPSFLKFQWTLQPDEWDSGAGVYMTAGWSVRTWGQTFA